MAKYKGPTLKLYKNYKTNLYLKQNIKKNYINDKILNKINSYFFFQLKEKQKLKFIYGVFDKQFKNYYLKSKKKNINIVNLLELRLDNILYRCGVFSTRKHARQAINHKFVYINYINVTYPSYEIKVGDLISFKKKYKLEIFNKSCDWIFFNYNILKGYIKRFPLRKEIFTNINEKLILDYYNK